MKLWRLRDDRPGRGRPDGKRPRLGPRLVVETLEGRTLLSTTKAVQKAASPPAPVFPAYDINPRIESPTDEGGANTVFEGSVKVGGYAAPYATVWLAEGLRPGYFTNIAQADATGHYAFVVPVDHGSTILQLFAVNATYDYSNIDTLTVNRGNPVEAWDSIALHAIQGQNLPAPEAARDLAVLHAAQYDAVANATQPDSAYQVHVSAPKGASAEAAADSAAFTTLTSLFPSQAPLFAAAERSALAGLSKRPAIEDGLGLGVKVANQTLANRANDGSNVTGSINMASAFAKVTPFEIASGSAFRPASPPAAGSSTFDQALAEVSSLGRATGSTRTSDQTTAAYFWDGSGAMTDPVHWNAIADQIAVSRKDSLATDARLFAELDFALADAAIASSDSQATYQEARPIVAAQRADPTFQPLLSSPSTPSYVSDNAAYGAAASQVLTSTFGSNVKFKDTSKPTLGIARTFSSFDAAATEDANSRVWAGVNFSFDARAGVTLGGKVAEAVLSGFPKGK